MFQRRVFRIGIPASILLCGLLVGCGPSDAEISQTRTALVVTSDAKKQSEFQTQTAAPPRIIAPTTTPKDAQEEYDRCRGAAYGGVSYTVTTKSGQVSEVSVTLENDSGGTDQGDFNLPFCRNFIGFSSGDSVNISAQIIQPTEGAGVIMCEIVWGGRLLGIGYADGYASIATCSGSVP